MKMAEAAFDQLIVTRNCSTFKKEYNKDLLCLDFSLMYMRPTGLDKEEQQPGRPRNKWTTDQQHTVH